MINKAKVRRIVASKNKLPKYSGGNPNVDAKIKLPGTQTMYGQAGGDNTAANAAAGSAGLPDKVEGSGMTTVGMMKGAGDIASGVGGMLMSDDAESTGNYAGTILGDAGKGASMGAALGPWGAGAGALVGGAYGLITANKAAEAQRAVKTKEQINRNLMSNNAMSGQVNANYNLRNMTNDRVPGLAGGTPSFKSNQMNPSQPNAMVAGQEGVMDGQTGRVSTVPGQYNSSNPDIVPANLTPGSSVFSNKKSQTLPGGKSTPADIIARTERMQKVNDKILTPKQGDRKPSRLDELTARLNQRNIQMQAENLNKFNSIVNPQVQQPAGLPGYAGGTPQSVKRFYTQEGGTTGITWLTNEEGAKNPKALVDITNIDENGYAPGTKNKIQLPSDKSMYTIGDSVIPVSNTAPDASQARSTNSVISQTQNVPGVNNNTVTTREYVGKGNTIASVQRKGYSTINPGSSDAQVNAGVANATASQNGIPVGGVYNPGWYDFTYGTPGMPPKTSSPQIPDNRMDNGNDYNTGDNSGNDRRLEPVTPYVAQVQQGITLGDNGTSSNTRFNYLLNKGQGLTTPTFKPDFNVPDNRMDNGNDYGDSNNETDMRLGTANKSVGVLQSDTDPSVPKVNYTTPNTTLPQQKLSTSGNGSKYQMYKQSDFPINQPAKQPKNPNTGNGSGIGNKLSKFGNNLMSLAPLAYNAWNATPEVASPIYDNYMNPNQRYNIAPELAEATKQRQIARYGNANTNTSTGANMAYGADTYSRGQEQLSGLMGKAQTENNQYRDLYANRYNQQAGAATAENRRIYDLNARNRAASRTFGAKNAEMLSQYGQTQQLMANQSANDDLNSYVYSTYNTAMTKEQRAEINRRLKIKQG